MFAARLLCVAALISVLHTTMVPAQAGAAEEPKVSVSAFAPADDLVRQADKFIETMQATVASKEEYDDSEGKIGRDANTLAVIALSLGLHDEENKYKPTAAAVIKAAQDVAATKDYAAAQKGVTALEAVATGSGTPGGKLKWEKVASLPDLMKQVPMVNTKLKTALGKAKRKKGKDAAGYMAAMKDAAGHSAVIAAIAQGVIADTSATKNADQVKLWQKFSKAMRDHAGAANAAIHKEDKSAVDKAMTQLNQSCEDCHAVFKPGVNANKEE